MEMQQIGKGKVRNIYDVGGDRLVLVTSDRVSAFDSVLDAEIPYKGEILNRISAFWFFYTKDIIPNHMISTENREMPEEFQTSSLAGRCMLVKKLKMLPIECIVRGYITGSGWDSYKEKGAVCGDPGEEPYRGVPSALSEAVQGNGLGNRRSRQK